MARRRSFLSVLAILILLHAYIGLRLLPALGIGLAGMVAGSILLAISAALVRIGLVRRACAARGGRNR